MVDDVDAEVQQLLVRALRRGEKGADVELELVKCLLGNYSVAVNQQLEE